MVFRVNYEWEIKNFDEFLETKEACLFSPAFIASPDEISHRWKVYLKRNSKFPEYYGIYLHLDDKPIQQPIFAKFSFKIYNTENELLVERVNIEYKYERSEGRGNTGLSLIDRSLCNFKSIAKICLEIVLSREEIISSTLPSLKQEVVKPIIPIKKTEDKLSQTERIDTSSSEKEVQTIIPIQKTFEKLTQTDPIDQLSTKVLREDFLKLYDGKEFADMSISCGEKDFQVHRNILSSRSSRFKSIFENNTDNNIKLDDDIDSEVFEVFLKFLYTGSIQIKPQMIDDILDLSEKYNVKDLSNICKCEMMKNISVLTAVKYLISADKHQMVEMKKNALKLIKANLQDVMKTEEWNLVSRYLLLEVLASVAVHDEN